MFQSIKSFFFRILFISIVVLIFLEVNHHKVYHYVTNGFTSELWFAYMKWAERMYLPYRTYAFQSNQYLWLPNIVLWAIALVGTCACVFFFFRKILIGFQKRKAELMGFSFKPQKFDFLFEKFDPKPFLFFKPRDSIFLGLTSKKQPFYLGALQRSTHIQIIGRTGSGKSKLLDTLLLQDIQEGKGVVFIDGKGDQETKEAFCGMAAQACRKQDVMIFDLVNQQDSWIYNPVFMRQDSNPVIVSEKMLSTFPCETDFYRLVQKGLFTLLLQIAHAKKIHVTLKDLHFAIRRKENLLTFAKHCPDESLIVELQDFLNINGNDYSRNIIGLESWLRSYGLIEQINRSEGAPEIDFQYVFEKAKLVYFRLPAGYAQTSARDIGNVVLQDLQFMAGLRQVLPNQSHHPFSIYVDEFAVFANESFIQAINKARSANIRWTIAHQSYSDLEAISPAFAEGVWDNCRTKIILSQRNQNLCEKVASELGTFQKIDRTERVAESTLFTRKEMGDASTKLVDEYVLHPNFLKNLHPYGQGYVVGENLKNKESYVGLNFGELKCPKAVIRPGNLTTVKNIGGIK